MKRFYKIERSSFGEKMITAIDLYEDLKEAENAITKEKITDIVVKKNDTKIN